jgi:hypothetical protein
MLSCSNSQSFQHSSDVQKIEQLALCAVTFCEKMGYVEGLARGLQVHQSLYEPRYGKSVY